MKRPVVVLLLGVLWSAVPGSTDGPPRRAHRVPHTSCGWQHGFHSEDLDGTVNVMVDCGDSRGPALCVGGRFDTAGGTVVNNVARWDGAEWSAVGDPLSPGVSGSVYALAVYDDGSGPGLYVGGSFNTTGTGSGSYLARLDASGWHPLVEPGDGELSGAVRTLAVFDDGSGPALYAAGWFRRIGNLTVNHVARWDGTSWSALEGPLEAGVDDWVHSLVVHDDGSGPALYGGGRFDTAGGVPVGRVARWDGTGWSWLARPPGRGMNDTVHALASFDDGRGPRLYAGGSFTDAAGEAVEHIASWEGESWSALPPLWGSGVQPWVSTLAVAPVGDADVLYVGWSTSANASPGSTVTMWTSVGWIPVTGPGDRMLSENVRSILAFDDGTGPALYVGGVMGNSRDSVANGIARLEGRTWTALSEPAGAGLTGSVRALAAFDSPGGAELVAGGHFYRAGGQPVGFVASWDGAAWSALSEHGVNGVTSWVRALSTYDGGLGPRLYAGGYFGSAGGEGVSYIAEWDGHSWSGLTGTDGTGTNGWVFALHAGQVGNARVLFVGGSFSSAGGLEVNRAARWVGGSWTALPGFWQAGVGGTVKALAVYDDGSGPALFAGGSFLDAGGRPAHFIARWRDGDWSALGGITGEGLSGQVYALAVFDDGNGPALYVGGEFYRAGTLEVNHVARWDGTSWSALPGPTSAGVDASVRALAVYDNGAGPALYAGGGFLSAGGVPVGGIARWDGSSWSSLGPLSTTSLNGVVHALTVVDLGYGPVLAAGGDFTVAGEVPSLHIGIWGCHTEVVVPAEIHGSGAPAERQATAR